MESGTIDPMKIEAEAFLPTEYGNFRIRVMEMKMARNTLSYR